MQPVRVMKLQQLMQGTVHNDLLRLAQYCNHIAAGKPLAFRRDFDPFATGWMLGSMYMVKVLDGGADYRFGLFGESMREVQGRDNTGRLLSEIGIPGLTDTLRDEFDEMMLQREMLYRRGRLVWPAGESIELERLLIPLAGDDGEIGYILGAQHYQCPLEFVVLFKGKGIPRLETEPYAPSVAA